MRRRIPIVVSGAALRPFVPVWRAAAPIAAQVAVPALFIAGLAAPLGPIGAWLVVCAAALGVRLRLAEVESWATFLPGGLPGRVRQAFGIGAGRVAAAAALLERLTFVALAAVLAGHYAVSLAIAVLSQSSVPGPIVAEDLVAPAAMLLVGLPWIGARRGREGRRPGRLPWVWLSAAALAGIALAGLVVLIARHDWADVVITRSAWDALQPFRGAAGPLGGWTTSVLAVFLAFGWVLPAIGPAETLSRVAGDLPQPRVQSARRALLLAAGVSVTIAVASTFAYQGLIPAGEQPFWAEMPLVGLARHVPMAAVLRELLTACVVVSAVLLLGWSVRDGLIDVELQLHRLVDAGVLPAQLRVQHPKFGTFSSLIDLAAIGVIGVIVIGGSHVAWLASAFAMAAAGMQVCRLAALLRLRRQQQPAAMSRVAGCGPMLAVLVVGAVALLASGGAAAWIATWAIGVLAILFLWAGRGAPAVAAAVPAPDLFQLLPSADLSLEHIHARPGAVLVGVRHPHLLDHLADACRNAGDSDVVVMTVRIGGPEAEESAPAELHPTPEERELFARVVALAERSGRAVHLLIVPARNVFEAVVAAVIRLQASEVYVGESATLSAAAQARLLGEAWEHAAPPATLKVRLVIHHSTGRNDTFFLGAHEPTLTPQDVDLIHRLWLDAAKSIGPHVHHHDLVRAALVSMSEQLNGPQRDAALDLVRRLARPADELAAVVRQRDFPRLRDMVRNLPPEDLAGMLADLPIEEQVVVFRLLPRKDAAGTFEYLAGDEQAALLRAMAQEDVAALLNEMAPDDRTNFLEELPAIVTRQLLALLTPTERTVAVTLLGYPEGSIGRLMTPNYVAVREEWTVQQVLDYVREHGQDSETLNVLYVVDDQGLLIDDIRIREVLLTSLDTRVSALMDRRFVALKATDSEDEAVGVFRQHDRSALPVTDTAGMLIGIVTIDDVLDVAEEKTTKEIQRIGGSEALEQPYMEIGFFSMMRKRAGWLTALFLGEMLTATAMAFFGGEISRAVELTFFIPLIISSGGNSGLQASTLVIRAMALGEVALGDWWRVMRREVAAGLALGTILGLIGFLRITVWSQFAPTYGEHWLLIAITVALALVGVVIWGTLSGSLLPMLLRRLGFDPATSSAPFVATLVDVTGLVIYFSVALVILHGTLL